MRPYDPSLSCYEVANFRLQETLNEEYVTDDGREAVTSSP